MNSKIFYILAGANGSGKSTIAKELLQEQKLVYINADDIAKELNPTNISKVKINSLEILNLSCQSRNFLSGISLFGHSRMLLSGIYKKIKIPYCRCY